MHIDITNKKLFLLSFYIGLAIGLAYWVIALLAYPDETLLQWLIFRGGDLQYYPLIESLARFEFSPTYSSWSNSDGIVRFPIYSLLIHAFLFSSFGPTGFIIGDVLFVTCTLFVIGKVLSDFGLPVILSLAVATLLYSLVTFPKIEHVLTLFVGFRIPRPHNTKCN